MLDAFYKVFPETKDMPLYITGESYAGMYIPFIAATLASKAVLSDGSPIQLAGLAIGNGVFNETIQQNPYLAADFFKQSGFFGNNSNGNEMMYDMAKRCSQNYTNDGSCDPAVVAQGWLNTFRPGVTFNVYDVHTDKNFTAAKEENLAKWLSDPSVQAALHVSPNRKNYPIAPMTPSNATNWHQCSLQELSYYDSPWSMAFKSDNAGDILELETRQGNDDYMCHHNGVEAVIGNLTWNGKTGFHTPLNETLVPLPQPNGPSSNFSAAATPAGYILSERSLTYVKIMNSGHQVPLYQPGAALAFLNRLLSAPRGNFVPGTPLSLPLQALGGAANLNPSVNSPPAATSGTPLASTTPSSPGPKNAASNAAGAVPIAVAIAAVILGLVL
ncbi:Alpha/Beta hydrolase protein [Blyttiomyces helicus]|uniref:Carboxypeptidase n=1 Tax=Blyttiomyces helicus TaxID=388810 RepID=A0A4P9VUB5_9FUNG|nr:Alpha/Beta hydrolase protein [Blyttiomyces helicus]|eukprot:RKO83174.1 Alpha/Beta hydrolase protein [Blyttiomyces helicus]